MTPIPSSAGRGRASLARGPQPIEIWLQDSEVDGGSRWLQFREPRQILVADRVEEVREVLARAEAATEEGLWAAGLVTYEAAPAFDPAFVVHDPGRLPLAYFGIFTEPEAAEAPGPLVAEWAECTIASWRPTVDDADYAAAIASIRSSIAAGDTYQVNYTLRLRGDFTGHPGTFFLDLQRSQAGRWGAWLDLGDQVVASASPELFFRLADEAIVARPMKGTVARGRFGTEDRERATWLKGSEKNRAENLMIVDMVRNDLGRIAVPGSVHVRSLFDIERYPSLFQLTSTVEARSAAPVREIFAALFPCASITGAPKVRTMELIHELETTQRGIYTGAIGYLAPARRAQFSVAIRGVQFDRVSGRAEYGTGGGIVWDSRAEEESREWRTKALVLGRPAPAFELLETIRWGPEEGFFLLERHLARLTAAADYFDFACDPSEVERRLAARAEDLPREPHRVRLLVAEDGSVSVEATALEPVADPWRVAIAHRPVDSGDRFLFHKTTRRRVYDEARAGRLEHDDVLLFNERGELTESTLANLMLEIDGRWLTPALDCGLLPGTLRAELLASGEIAEAHLALADLARADAVWLINSVRGRIAVEVDLATLPGAAPIR